MLLSVSSVSKNFGVDIVLENVNFRLEAREKVALVGRNGTGKTTLLKIITKQHEPDTGTVLLSRGAKIGYLRQEAQVDAGRTVIQEAEEALKNQLSMKARLQQLEIILENGTPTADDLEEYALLHEHFLDAEGYSAERDLRVVLQKMGFTEEEFDKPTSKLSGGEKTRLAIARLLLEEPDLLILDEPTNHLDLQATEWLESWIRSYHGAVLLVSHDRTFLENTADRVLELRDCTIRPYPGPFGKYLQLRAEEDERLIEVAKRQDQEIAKMDEYVRRFMNSQRTAQARGRLKLMNRLVENRVDAPKNEAQMKGGFGTVKRSGDLVLTAEKLSVGFPNPSNPEDIEYLFKDFEWTVRFGERWGIIGENGAGKSTLVKVAMGAIEPLSGKTRIGSNVVVGYFTQDASDLDQELSPIDMFVFELDLKPAEARNLLARFLITGDDVYRPIKTMSGGEKNKLSLAKLTHLNPNLLILDEPTNHLDMASRDALAKVLRDFQGTLVLVSHDRWLLEQVSDHTLDVKRSGSIQYPGGYTEYRRKQKTLQANTQSKTTQAQKQVEAPKPPEFTPRELSKEIGRMEKLVEQTEQEISTTEEDIKKLEDVLSNIPADADLLSLTQKHQDLQNQLEQKMTDWENHSTRLEQLRQMQG